MGWVVVKYLVTAAVIVAVSEAANRSDKLGAVIAALPLVTVLAMIWLRVEGADPEKIAAHARYTFWYVIPTLPMFLAFPALLVRIGFWPALGLSALITVACFAATAAAARLFGVDLL
ncbi:MAG TPA: DUF3147 family protein [Ramlibacter sp.]|nr:DUF3147 family protein [Ramlibacter sp.]